MSSYILYAYRGSALECLEVAETLGLYEVEILFSVQVRLILRLEVQLVVVPVELIEVVHRNVLI
jgi:hypothetical protein